MFGSARQKYISPCMHAMQTQHTHAHKSVHLMINIDNSIQAFMSLIWFSMHACAVQTL